MTVTIEIAGIRASIKNGAWACEDATLQRALTAQLDPDGPAGSDPYPDYTEAERAVEALGGQIVAYTEPPALPAGAIA